MLQRDALLVLCLALTDVTRLNFFEVARAAFFSKYQSEAEVARTGLVHYSRGSYGQKDLFSAMSLETWPLIGHDSMMCKDQEYVKNYTYDLISHVLYQCAF